MTPWRHHTDCGDLHKGKGRGSALQHSWGPLRPSPLQDGSYEAPIIARFEQVILIQ